MGYRHDRVTVLAGAIAEARESGLHAVTFGSVGRRIGVPDRTVVYYFPSKAALIAAILQDSTDELLRLLDPIGPRRRAADELLSVTWSVLRTEDADRPLRIYVEMLGLSARGDEPYRSAVARLLAEWAGWFADRLSVPEHERVDRSRALVALLDGLIVMHIIEGAATSSAAVRGIGELG